MSGERKKIDVKNVLSVIGTVITVIIFAIAGYLMINIVVCRVKNEPVRIFGYSFAIVQTGSMEPDIMTGDLIVFRSVDYESIAVGDVIVFRADSSYGEKEGQTIVHKVVEITSEGLVTKGVNEVTNKDNDGGVRDESELLGICIANSAFWGAIFTFLGKYGILILILVVSAPIIVKLIIKIVKLSKEKDEVESDLPQAENAECTAAPKVEQGAGQGDGNLEASAEISDENSTNNAQDKQENKD